MTTVGSTPSAIATVAANPASVSTQRIRDAFNTHPPWVINDSIDKEHIFQNDTGITLTGLSLDLFPGNLAFVFTCGNNAGLDIFANCTSKSGSHGDSLLSFFGVGNGFSGLTAATCTKGGDDDQGDNDSQGDDGPSCVGGVFSLVFQAPSSEVPNGAQVLGTGTVSAPEPMTSVLLVSGLLGLAGLRKRRAFPGGRFSAPCFFSRDLC